jgi:hypothetical protein
MPLDHCLQTFFRDVRALGRNLVPHHHRRGRGQARCPVRIALVFFPGSGNVHHFKVIFLAQPGHDLAQAFSGQAVRLVQKKSDFKHANFLLRIIFS